MQTRYLGRELASQEKAKGSSCRQARWTVDVFRRAPRAAAAAMPKFPPCRLVLGVETSPASRTPQLPGAELQPGTSSGPREKTQRSLSQRSYRACKSLCRGWLAGWLGSGGSLLACRWPHHISAIRQ